MNTFIRLAEVWIPSTDASMLELAGGLFDAAPAYGAISHDMCFGRAEGLPGRAWDEGRPLLLRQLEGSYFKRAAAARAVGLTCAVAWPVFLEGALTCVVVLLCGDASTHVGSVELWHNDPRVGTDLRLADGYFGTGSPALEELTRDAGLPRGAGAPGLAWQRDAAVFIGDISASKHFLRGPEAHDAGIVSALAFPCRVPARQNWVLCLLSSKITPIARRVEVWRPNAEGTHLERVLGHCEVRGALSGLDAPAFAIDSPASIAEVFRSGVAQAVPGTAVHGEKTNAAPGRPNQARTATEGEAIPMSAQEADAAGVRSLLAVPVMDESGVAEVVCLYF